MPLDSNKFGQKMLEKMGWQHGKGLGANEDGITEHIKVSYKNDSKGMGYKESNDQWTEHETNFSALLESLSGAKPEEVKLNSLEKKSQSSRARVHYHKFTRGKDLSRYSEKDLANIFGKKSLKESSKVGVKEEKPNNSEKNEDESKFLFNAGSMRDYFKKKLPGFSKSNGYVVGHNGVLKKEESDSETDPRPSFSFNPDKKDSEETSYAGFGFKREFIADKTPDIESEPSNGKPTFISYINGDYSKESNEKKSKKKRKVEEKDGDNIFSPKKKLRKNKDGFCKKSSIESESGKGVSNPAFNPLRTPVKIQKHMLDTIEESVSEDVSDLEDNILKYGVTTAEVYENPEKKKKHLSENTRDNVETEEYNDVCRKTKKKSKKLKEQKNGVVNNVFIENDVVDLTLNGDKENEVEICPLEVERKENKKEKQKHSHISEKGESPDGVKDRKLKKKGYETNVHNDIDLTIDESVNVIENVDVSNVCKKIQIDENPYEVKVKKTKKKKKENVNIDLTTDDSGVSYVAEEIPPKPKIKKKKNDKTFALENPCFDDSFEDSIDLTGIDENPYEIKVKKKKKKAKLGFDNVNFSESIEDSVNSSQNNPFEVKIISDKKKKIKRNEEYAIENPNFNESIEEPTCTDIKENPYEVKPKKKKKKKKDDTLAIDNPNFNTNDFTEISNDVQNINKKVKQSNEDDNNVPQLTPDGSSSDIQEHVSLSIEESDLMLNIVTTPIITRPEGANNENSYSVTRINNARRRKSVRFSDVTQERIIPNNDDLRNLSDIENRNELFEINTQVINRGLEEQNISFDMSSLDKFSYDNEKSDKQRKLGLDNAAFDKQNADLEENLDSISKTIDRYQAEIENDINEKKLETLTVEDIMIGEVGNPHGEHEKLPDGTKLKFKYANFASRTPFYHLDKTGAKKAYKHLIKGDIMVRFKNTNLHEIQGYAAKRGTRSTRV